MGSSIERPSLAMEAELSERQKWELSPVEQLKVAVYRRELGNAEMRHGHPQEVHRAAMVFQCIPESWKYYARRFRNKLTFRLILQKPREGIR